MKLRPQDFAPLPPARLGTGTPNGTKYLRDDGTWQTVTGGAGVTAHNLLTGLSTDDHPQYHNDARGDARYSPLGHTHSFETAGAVAAHAGASDPHPQYLTVVEANALYAAIDAAAPLSVLATVTVPAGRMEHSETVAFTGCTTLKRLLVSIASHADTDENDAEMLDVAGMSATPGEGSAVVTLAFRDPTTGPIKLNLMAV